MSVGEGIAAVPVIRKCLEQRPSVQILLTTRSAAAMSVLRKLLPAGALVQYAPADTPQAVARFLGHWRPQAAIFLESELWPNLLLSPLLDEVPLALINARVSAASLERWSIPAARPLAAAMLQRFLLVVPLNTEQGARLQALGVRPPSVRFAGDLKYATAAAAADPSSTSPPGAELRAWLPEGRHRWLAASTHAGEEETILRVHRSLARNFPGLLTIIAPRHPQRGAAIDEALRSRGVRAARRSLHEAVTPEAGIYIADTLGAETGRKPAVQVRRTSGSRSPGPRFGVLTR